MLGALGAKAPAGLWLTLPPPRHRDSYSASCRQSRKKTDEEEKLLKLLQGIHKPQDGFTQWCEQMLHALNTSSSLDGMRGGEWGDPWSNGGCGVILGLKPGLSLSVGSRSAAGGPHRVASSPHWQLPVMPVRSSEALRCGLLYPRTSVSTLGPGTSPPRTPRAPCAWAQVPFPVSSIGCPSRRMPVALLALPRLVGLGVELGHCWWCCRGFDPGWPPRKAPVLADSLASCPSPGGDIFQ